MSKRNGGFGIGTGGASILVVFVLLCLTTFATLSIVSANADYKLTQQSARAASEYYKADLQATELLYAVGAGLAETRNLGEEAPTNATPEQVVERCRNAVKAGSVLKTVEGENSVQIFAQEQNITVTQTEEGANISYAVPMGNTRELQVRIAVDMALNWRIAAWQTVTTEEWVGNNSIELWDGGNIGMANGLPPDFSGDDDAPVGLAALPEGVA